MKSKSVRAKFSNIGKATGSREVASGFLVDAKDQPIPGTNITVTAPSIDGLLEMDTDTTYVLTIADAKP
jgi:hypothetical protein